MTVGASYEGDLTPAVLLDLAKAADVSGAGTLWIASHLFQREPIVNCAMVLAATSRLSVGLMAMSPFVMHPVHITMAAAALDEWYPGRVVLCFGTGSPRDLASVGLAAGKPLGVIRESIGIARALLAGEVVQWRGERFRAEGRRLSSGQREIPIYVAASGPRMLELSGAEADGVLISAATSPAFVAWALGHVAAGEAKAGRRVQRAALVYCGDRATIRRNLAFVLRGAHHAHNLELAGTRLDQAALTEAFAAEDWARVDRLVDDPVLDSHSAAGTPAQMRAALDRYRAVGLDEIVMAGVRNGADLRDLMAHASAV